MFNRLTVILCWKFICGQPRSYIADNEKDLTKEEVIKRLGQPDKYIISISEFENIRQENFYYGNERIIILNGELSEFFITSPKCRLNIPSGPITIGDNISILIDFENIAVTKIKDDKYPNMILYSIGNDCFNGICGTDNAGNIISFYYTVRD